MNRRRLLRRLTSGAVNNVAFADFTDLVEGFGFELDRIEGSHRLYRHPRIPQRMSVQPLRNEAKPYQIRQFLRLIEEHDLRLEDDE